MSSDPTHGYDTPHHYAVSAGTYKDQAEQYVRDIDSAMRANYSINLQRMSENIYPILYAESTFDGGRYTFVVDADTSYGHENVNPIYDQTKAISHIPLGIFSIISAYAAYPALKQWVAPLQAYADQLMKVRDNLGVLEMPEPYKTGCLGILIKSLKYISDIIAAGTFTLEEFSNYSRSLASLIANNQDMAAREQFTTMSAVLADWKSKVGQVVWDKMFVVVSAIWTLSVESAHELIIKSAMKEEFRQSNVFVSEAVPTLSDARILLARVVGDRVMAELVFNPAGTDIEKQNIASLSTRRDLLSKAIEQYTGNVAKATCPYMHS